MVATKSASLDKTQTQSLLNNALQTFQKACNSTTPSNTSELEKYFAQNFQLTTNGQSVTRSLNDFVSRIQKFQKKYSNTDIQRSREEPVISENKAAIHYTINFTSRSGQKVQVYVSAIATIENNKITQWSQTAAEKGAGNWDV